MESRPGPLTGGPGIRRPVAIDAFAPHHPWPRALGLLALCSWLSQLIDSLTCGVTAIVTTKTPSSLPIKGPRRSF